MASVDARMSQRMSPSPAFQPLSIAVLTISDTRSAADDRSGDLLVERLQASGHRLAARALVVDDHYAIRAQVSQWIADPAIDVVLCTGGTGFAPRDVTPDALRPLLDVEVDGFGELFRQRSTQEIGSSTVQSRALAGLANRTLVCALPGSPGACRLAWDAILVEQLDAGHRPCNFVALLRP